MPVITREIHGTKYVYVARWNPKKKRRELKYVGRADDVLAQKKASELEARYQANRIRPRSGAVDPAFKARVIREILYEELVKVASKLGGYRVVKNKKFDGTVIDVAIFGRDNKPHLVDTTVATRWSTVVQVFGKAVTWSLKEPCLFLVFDASVAGSEPKDTGRKAPKGTSMVFYPLDSLDEVSRVFLGEVAEKVFDTLFHTGTDLAP